MDYEKCWERLAKELRYLSDKGVRSIDPEVILAFMSFIEVVEVWAKGKEVK